MLVAKTLNKAMLSPALPEGPLKSTPILLPLSCS